MFKAAVICLVGIVGIASATDVVQIRRVVRVEQNVPVRVEVRRVEVRNVPVRVERVQVEEVVQQEVRTVGPVRSFFRGLFGLPNTDIVERRTVRVRR